MEAFELSLAAAWLQCVEQMWWPECTKLGGAVWQLWCFPCVWVTVGSNGRGPVGILDSPMLHAPSASCAQLVDVACAGCAQEQPQAPLNTGVGLHTSGSRMCAYGRAHDVMPPCHCGCIQLSQPQGCLQHARRHPALCSVRIYQLVRRWGQRVASALIACCSNIYR